MRNLTLTILLVLFFGKVNSQCPGIYGMHKSGPSISLRTYNFSFNSMVEVKGVNIGSGFTGSVFIDHKAQYIVNHDSYYYIIDALSGNLLDSLPMPEPGYSMISPAYDVASDKIYGVYYKGGQEYFASIHAGTKATNIISVLPGVTSIPARTSAFNSRTGEYIVATNTGMLVINTSTGAVTDTLPVVNDFLHIQYDSLGDKLYGVYFTGGKEYLAYYDFNSSNFADVGQLAGVTGTTSSTYNKYQQRFILATNVGIIDVDVANASYVVLTGPDDMTEIQFGLPQIPPAPEIYQSGDTLYSNTTGDRYIWVKNGEVLQHDSGFVTPATPGKYNLLIGMNNGCVTTPSEDYIIWPPAPGCPGVYGVYRLTQPPVFRTYHYGSDSLINIEQVFPGGGFLNSVFINKKAQYIGNGLSYYYVIDAISGKLIDSIPMPDSGYTMIAPAYDETSDKIYGVYFKGGQEYFASIHTATKTRTVMGTLPGVTGISNHSSTFNTRTNQYITGTNLGILIVNAATGVVADTLVLGFDFNHVQYDSFYNKLYGVYFTGGKEYLGAYHFGTHTFSTVGMIAGVSGTTYSSYNKYEHRYLLGCNLGTIDIDVNTGAYNILAGIDQLEEIQFGIPVLPVPSIHQSGDTLISSLNGVAYIWRRNGNVIPNNTLSIADPEPGYYNVSVKLPNGCVTDPSADFVVWPPLAGCRGIYGVYRSGSSTHLKTYNYETDSVINMGEVALGNGFVGSVFINHKAQYIVNHNSKYYIIDALQGVVIDSLPMPEAGYNMIAPAYDPASDKIFGVYSKAGQWYVASIHTVTKATQVFGAIPMVTGISNHSSTFNTRMNQYIVGTNMGPASINAATGMLVDFIPSAPDFNHVQYDSLYNKLYGVYFTGGKEYLAYFNFANQNFTNVGQLASVTGTAFSTYNTYEHNYILGSNIGIMDIDVNTGTYNVLMPENEMTEIQFGVPQLPVPVISLLAGDSLTSNVNGVHYAWFRDSVLLSENTKTIHVTAAGNYVVTALLKNGCLSGVSAPYAFPPVTGIADIISSGSFGIYPNPSSSNMLHVVVPSSVQTGKVFMYDMNGRAVLHQQIDHNGDQTINVEGYAKGMYVIRIETDSGASFHAKYIRQ